ncbi:antiviral helicase SKI2 [Pancytospora philotis]|nr:antiviral helicase SKI2 [Pancytospora philotis]
MAASSFDTTTLRGALETERHAVLIKQDWVPADYAARVDESILKVDFRPDVFQKQSFYFLSQNKPTFVAAHTSSGKTLVAEYAVFRAEKNGTRVIYTSPIKALSNQKFYDFKHKFADVGLITGDVQVNPDAQCLIMTTEILRNMVYRNSDVLRDTEYVIFDEVHYINDADRGVVWEEAIIMMPRHVSMVFLSATIPNALEFGEWVGRTRRECVYVISTNKRAVPLEFAVYCDSDAYRLDDRPRDGHAPSNFAAPLGVFSGKVRPKRRFSVSDLGNYIANRRLLPAIFFSFSKRACEEYGKTLQLLDLTSPAEKKKIAAFLEQAFGALSEQDRFLPQVLAMKQQAARGVAVHHGGLLPFVKECIELLFASNLVKILIATETFAMGVNMPAKCCAFLSVTKMDCGAQRFLTPAEFIQMSGRAGRRGMDRVGTVLIADQKMHPIESIKRMITGTPYNLSSQFKLSFSLILMAFRSNIEVEELMRNSFKEHGAQKGATEDMLRLGRLEAVRPFSCAACGDCAEMLASMALICRENFSLIKKVVKLGDTLILKNNTTVEVRQIDGNRLTIGPRQTALAGPLFATQTTLCADGARIPEGHCAHPIDRVAAGCSGTVEFRDVFALVRGDAIALDYGITDIQHVQTMLDLGKALARLEGAACLACPDFSAHYYEIIESARVQREIRHIKEKYDRNSLIQIGEYSARLRFLRAHGYIDQFIELKGRAAAEIRTVNEIVVVELILENFFADCDPSELIALFSSMVYETRDEEDFEVPERFRERVDTIKEMYGRLSDEMCALEIPKMSPLNFGMVCAVHDWCSGDSLGAIVAKHGIQEGAFVRLILRLEECCREMVNVAALIGDEGLGQKFAEASAIIKRDIIFMPSLYI